MIGFTAVNSVENVSRCPTFSSPFSPPFNCSDGVSSHSTSTATDAMATVMIKPSTNAGCVRMESASADVTASSDPTHRNSVPVPTCMYLNDERDKYFVGFVEKSLASYITKVMTIKTINLDRDESVNRILNYRDSSRASRSVRRMLGSRGGSSSSSSSSHAHAAGPAPPSATEHGGGGGVRYWRGGYWSGGDGTDGPKPEPKDDGPKPKPEDGPEPEDGPKPEDDGPEEGTEGDTEDETEGVTEDETEGVTGEDTGEETGEEEYTPSEADRTDQTVSGDGVSSVDINDTLFTTLSKIFVTQVQGNEGLNIADVMWMVMNEMSQMSTSVSSELSKLQASLGDITAELSKLRETISSSASSDMASESGSSGYDDQKEDDTEDPDGETPNPPTKSSMYGGGYSDSLYSDSDSSSVF